MHKSLLSIDSSPSLSPLSMSRQSDQMQPTGFHWFLWSPRGVSGRILNACLPSPCRRRAFPCIWLFLRFLSSAPCFAYVWRTIGPKSSSRSHRVTLTTTVISIQEFSDRDDRGRDRKALNFDFLMKWTTWQESRLATGFVRPIRWRDISLHHGHTAPDQPRSVVEE
jgi:hypothetical protein